jgi:Ca2+-binding EF-hand superfamily protein
LDVARRLFEQFDTDKSGYLTEPEIPNLLKETYRQMGMTFNPSTEDVKSWMKMTDLDGDGKVTLEDYENLIIRSLERVGIKIFD